MSTRQQRPEVSYLIEAAYTVHAPAFYFRIDQALPSGSAAIARERLDNQMARHLNHLYERTGFFYHILYSASPERVDDFIKAKGIEVH